MLKVQSKILERPYGANHPLQFIVTLWKLGKNNTDIEDIVCQIKENLTDTDSAIFEKKYVGDSGITFTGTDRLIVSVEWPYNEYTNFTIGKEYFLGLFCKFTGEPNYDERVKQIFKIKVIQDFSRA